MTKIILILCTIVYLNIFTLTTSLKTKPLEMIENEVARIMKGVMQGVENETIKINNKLNKLVKNSSATINEIMKPIEARRVAIENQMKKLESQYQDEIKELEEESDRIIEDMKKQMDKERARLNDQNIVKMDSLEKKLVALQNPVTSEDLSEQNLINAIAKDLKNVWDNSYRINDDLEEKLAEIKKTNYMEFSKNLEACWNKAEKLRNNLNEGLKELLLDLSKDITRVKLDYNSQYICTTKSVQDCTKKSVDYNDALDRYKVKCDDSFKEYIINFIENDVKILEFVCE